MGKNTKAEDALAILSDLKQPRPDEDLHPKIWNDLIARYSTDRHFRKRLNKPESKSRSKQKELVVESQQTDLEF